MSRRKPFAGSQRGLVIAFDVGTTFSGVSYSVLDPGVEPEIKGVTRFPGQSPGGSSKIASVLYYDATGVARAIGAETQLPSVIEQAEDEQWTKVEWFKMHLRPNSDTSQPAYKHIPSLPPNKSLVEVLADFLQYLLACTKSFVEETMLPDGVHFWDSIKDRIIFVLSHPNGWEGAQQSYMRRASVLAGLVTKDPEDQGRIHFVTEGEASLHFCVNNGLRIAEDEGIVILDAGGGTIDLSAYSSGSGKTISFKEISRSECCFAGSIFVTEESRTYFRDKLRGTDFYGDVPRITDIFDQTSKLQFRNSDEPSFVRFGGRDQTDPTLNIRSGQMKIPGPDVARFFEPSIKAALKAVVKQRSDARKTITSVFLVGGFAASPWLFSKLRDGLQPLGLSIHRPDTHVNKAVSDGAVSFYLDHYVTGRVSRWSYGLKCWTRYNAHDTEHQRRGYITDDISGKLKVLNKYSSILRKDVQVLEEQEFRAGFYRETSAPLDNMSVEILYYQGSDKTPLWTDVDSEMYSTACTVTADISQVSPKRLRNPRNGLIYYETEYDVILLFGLTELKAQIAWKENGVEKRSPAQVVYEQD